MLSQIPYPLNNKNGIFYVGPDEIMTCFSLLDQAAYKNDQGYRNYWYDVDNDPQNGIQRAFTIVPQEKRGRIYISVESYYHNMIPSPECHSGTPTLKVPYVDLVLYKNGDQIGGIDMKPMHNSFSFILDDDHKNSYEAGDELKLTVKWNWLKQKTSRDYTVVVYSQQPIAIKDELGQTN